MSCRNPIPDKNYEDWFIIAAFLFVLWLLTWTIVVPTASASTVAPSPEVVVVDDGFWFAVNAGQSPSGYRLICIGSDTSPDIVICVPAKNVVLLEEEPA